MPEDFYALKNTLIQGFWEPILNIYLFLKCGVEHILK